MNERSGKSWPANQHSIREIDSSKFSLKQKCPQRTFKYAKAPFKKYKISSDDRGGIGFRRAQAAHQRT